MDIHILAQGIVYFCMFIAGLAMSVTIGVNRGRFDGQCILYASFASDEENFRLMEASSASTCDYPIYVSVVGLVLHGVFMSVYYIYSFINSKREPDRGFQMWVLPMLLLNGLLFIFLLVAACIVSVGYSVFCSNYLEGFPEGTKCSVGNNKAWKHMQTGEKFYPGNYVAFMNSSMIFAWLGLLFVIIQLALGILRVYRNKHQGTNRMSESDTSPLPM